MRSFSFYLAVIVFFAVGLGCTTTDHLTEDDTGRSVLEMLGTQDSLTGGHMMGDAPLKEPNMAQVDRKYLEEQCSGCHDLNRIFWTRGPRSTWEKVLNQEQHLEVDLKPEEKEQLYQIFQQYLSQP